VAKAPEERMPGRTLLDMDKRCVVTPPAIQRKTHAHIARLSVRGARDLSVTMPAWPST
jgi:hypothetical protein